MTHEVGQQPTDSKPFPPGMVPIISLDNASIHVKAKQLAKKGVPRLFPGKSVKFWELPAYSPDIHKVIEHVHGTVYNAFKKQLIECDSRPETWEPFFGMVKAAFLEHVTTASVRGDIASLQETLKQIVEAKGGWPSKKYR
jgi:hypothetical protein